MSEPKRLADGACVLEVRDLTKRFGGVTALAGISLSVAAGERRVLLGTNGAGKTTLFNLISGLLQASGGQIYLQGVDITREPAHRRAALGLARTFQITNLFPRLTVRENLVLAAQALHPARMVTYRTLRSVTSLSERTDDLLSTWGLSSYGDQPVGELSYGIQRKIELVMAVASEPRVLLLDEPTAGLSGLASEEVVRMIHSLGREITILMIEHDMRIAVELATRISVLHQGKVLAEDTPENIRSNPSVQEVYLGSPGAKGR